MVRQTVGGEREGEECEREVEGRKVKEARELLLWMRHDADDDACRQQDPRGPWSVLAPDVVTVSLADVFCNPTT